VNVKGHSKIDSDFRQSLFSQGHCTVQMVEGFSSKKIVCVYLEIKIKEVERPVLSNFHLYKKEDENIHENVNLGY